MNRLLPLLLALTTLTAACTSSFTPPTAGRPSSHTGSPRSATASSPLIPAPEPAFFGLDVPMASTSSAARFGVEVGHQPSVLGVFIRLDTTTTANKMRTLRSAGLVPFVTLEPWHLGSTANRWDPRDSLTRVADGADDAALLAQAHELDTYRGPFYLRFAHEMNASWYPWGVGARDNTAALYVRAWRHVHQLFGTVARLHPRWVWSPLIVQADGAHGSLTALYPGDSYVDYVGVTGYEHHAASAATTFTPTLDAVRHITAKPIVLAEIGVDSASKTAWLASLGPYLATHPDIAGFVYFNTTPATTGASGHYALTSASERAALARTISALNPSTTSHPSPDGTS